MLDEYDLKILGVLQVNADLSLSEICKAVGIGSASAASKRLKELRKKGFIHKTVAIVDHELLGYKFRTLTTIRMGNMRNNGSRIIEKLSKLNGVMAAYETLGENEILLITVSKDLEQYQHLISAIREIDGVETMKTKILSKVLFENELPTLTTTQPDVTE
ncbi:MAG: Lrp/AsnC family transcriptional regulator [Thermoplasmataceae archaeon]